MKAPVVFLLVAIVGAGGFFLGRLGVSSRSDVPVGKQELANAVPPPSTPDAAEAPTALDTRVIVSPPAPGAPSEYPHPPALRMVDRNEKVVRDYLEGILSKSRTAKGSSWYTRSQFYGDFASGKRGTIDEVKVSKPVNLIAYPLSEADKLNGIEWSGRAEIAADAFRTFSEDNKSWSEWKGGQKDYFWISLEMKSGVVTHEMNRGNGGGANGWHYLAPAENEIPQ